MQWFDFQETHGLAIPFALDANGQWRDVGDVERGLDCACLCPECRGPLVAKKGAIRTHHFAHHDRRECRHALEASLFGMAMELLAAPMAALALPPYGARRALIHELGAKLSPEQEAHFLQLDWILGPSRVFAPSGFVVCSKRLEESALSGPDLIDPKTKLAVHFLSHRKTFEQIRGVSCESGWQVLAINLSHYVSLWWNTCDEDKDAKVTEAKAARGQMRRWLGKHDTGRGFLHHPHFESSKAILRSWLEAKHREQREIERREVERRIAAERAANAKWLVSAPTEAPDAALVFKAIRDGQTARLTEWLAHELGLRKHPAVGSWVFAAAPGHIVPPIVRGYLDAETPWRAFDPAPSEQTVAGGTPSKKPVAQDEILIAGVSICVLCGSPVDEVILGSGLFSGRRAQRCSVNERHPLKMMPRS